VIECCATCEYWSEKYRQCENPEQRADEADAYMAPPEKVCELYCLNYEMKMDGDKNE